MKTCLAFFALVILSGSLAVHAQEASESAQSEHWITVFNKRTFLGPLKQGEAGATTRMPIFIPVPATKVRAWFVGLREQPVEIARVELIKAADSKGGVTGEPVPLLFHGQPGITLAAKAKLQPSDIATATLSPGLWYVEMFLPQNVSNYAYDVDGGFCAKGDIKADPSLKFSATRGAYVGALKRLDILPSEPAALIVCYGDSITQGYGATPMSGNRYPALLGQRLNRPTLNLGVNGDFAKRNGMLHRTLDSTGAKDLIFLMGINDILRGELTSLADYTQSVAKFVPILREKGVNVYFGTLLPAGGTKAMDPGKEKLRQEINEWIRGKFGPKYVVDFDAALRDPADPSRMLPEYQCGDWLHPSDAGYQKMAETAAQALQSGGL